MHKHFAFTDLNIATRPSHKVCRTKDIFLASSIGRKSSGSSGGIKERPKLNLTVKKELQGMGGQIMAQSRMAKGPDGTDGFVAGWTTRVSTYDVVEEESPPAQTSLSAAAAAASLEVTGILVKESPPQLEHQTSLSAAASEFVPTFAIPSAGFDSTETEDRPE